MSLEALFTPRAVAVIGSMSPGKLGAVLLKQLIDGGYAGDLFAVNPKAAGAFAVPGYDSVAGIHKPVDLAILACPASGVADVLEDCGQSGVRAAVIITAGFSEVGNRQGELALLRIAQRHGIRLVGPNCAGIVNTHHHLYPTLEWRSPQGGVALISQSGALGGVVLAWAAEQNLGISKFVSYGNGVDLGQTELLDYLSEDPETKVVAVYIESIPDGRRFLEALASCASRKPVVVIKAGTTEVGKRATASHTGSMAGSDAVYEEAIRSAGAVRVETVEEMLDLCRAFSAAPLPRGRRLAIVTNSGGPAVLAADYAEKLGLQVSEPSAGLKSRLREFLSPNCALKNPIDMTVEGTEESYRKTLAAVLEEFDAAIAMDICPPYLDSVGLARGVLAGSQASGKTVLANFLPPQVVDPGVALLQAQGMANYSSGERAATAIAAMARYAELQTRRRSAPIQPPAPTAKAAVDLFKETSSLLEPEAMAWLKKEGLPVPPFGTAVSAAEAAEVSRRIGFPVVMKVVSPDILHKSDQGGVVLDIQNEAEAQQAYERIARAADGKVFRGVVIYPMVRGGREVLIGLTRDPQFGPVVAFGLGGIFTETLRDITLRMAPVTAEAAHDMIRAIRGYGLLAGQRGEAPYDVAAVADLLVKFSQLPFSYPDVGEIDLNPVFVLHSGALVGDVRVIRRKQEADDEKADQRS